MYLNEINGVVRMLSYISAGEKQNNNKTPAQDTCKDFFVPYPLSLGIYINIGSVSLGT